MGGGDGLTGCEILCSEELELLLNLRLDGGCQELREMNPRILLPLTDRDDGLSKVVLELGLFEEKLSQLWKVLCCCLVLNGGQGDFGFFYVRSCNHVKEESDAAGIHACSKCFYGTS